MSATPCPICSGTGWKPASDNAGAATGASSTSAPSATVVRCDCQTAASQDEKLRAAGIPPRYEHCDFPPFYAAGHENPAFNESLQNAKVIAEGFARDYPTQGDTGLLFMGPSGVGKTHLGVAVLRQLADRGFAVLFTDFRDLLKQIQASYNPVAQTTEMEVLTPVLETDILLLDDLGATKPSAWVLDTVAHILNTRYNEKRTTLITTNYLDEPGKPTGRLRAEDSLADRIGERMLSRLHEMCRFVHLHSADFRRVVKKA